MAAYARDGSVRWESDGAVSVRRVLVSSEEAQESTWSPETVLRLRAQGFCLKKICMNDMYPREGIRALHAFVLTPDEKAARLAALREGGVTWSDAEPLVVMHAASNTLDCNAEALLFGPHSLNMQMLRSKPSQRGVSFYGRGTEYRRDDTCGFKPPNRRLSTRGVPTALEACHAIDCLKIYTLLCNHERGRAQFLLQHAMHRPAPFAAYYCDVDTLAARFAALYAPLVTAPRAPRSVKAARVVPVTPDAVRLLNVLVDAGQRLAELPAVLAALTLDAVNALVQSRNVFVAGRDVFYEYRGTRGLHFMGLIWRAHFDRLLVRHSLHLKNGYPSMGRNRLHRMVCWCEGVDISQRRVQHSFDARLDARASSLQPDQGRGDGSNMRTVVRKTEHSVSKHAGVSLDKRRDRWVARIRFCYVCVVLGSFGSELAASACYARAFENQLRLQRDVRAMLGEGRTKREVAAFVRSKCKA